MPKKGAVVPVARPDVADCLREYDTWIAVETAAVYASADAGAKVRGKLARGDVVKGKVDESLRFVKVAEGPWKDAFVALLAGGSMVVEPVCKELSVVVPTYNEIDNVEPLCRRLFAALAKSDLDPARCELLLVDDESSGSDQTLAIVEKLHAEGFAIRIRARRKTEGRGLSSAVLEGLHHARYWNMVCMDADLQHEPEAVASVARPVVAKEAAMSVGSRYCEGGGLGFEWHWLRRAISVTATLLARGVSTTSDPMSGFFCVRKSCIFNGSMALCSPIGFKIGLEVGAKCELRPVADVPISFQERAAGESKLSQKQMVEYIYQLYELYLFVAKRNPAGTALVLVVLMVLLMILLSILAMLFPIIGHALPVVR